jgi:hypothetical protein
MRQIFYCPANTEKYPQTWEDGLARYGKVFRATKVTRANREALLNLSPQDLIIVTLGMTVNEWPSEKNITVGRGVYGVVCEGEELNIPVLLGLIRKDGGFFTGRVKANGISGSSDLRAWGSIRLDARATMLGLSDEHWANHANQNIIDSSMNAKTFVKEVTTPSTLRPSVCIYFKQSR